MSEQYKAFNLSKHHLKKYGKLFKKTDLILIQAAWKAGLTAQSNLCYMLLVNNNNKILAADMCIFHFKISKFRF